MCVFTRKRRNCPNFKSDSLSVGQSVSPKPLTCIKITTDDTHQSGCYEQQANYNDHLTYPSLGHGFYTESNQTVLRRDDFFNTCLCYFYPLPITFFYIICR